MPNSEWYTGIVKVESENGGEGQHGMYVVKPALSFSSNHNNKYEPLHTLSSSDPTNGRGPRSDSFDKHKRFVSLRFMQGYRSPSGSIWRKEAIGMIIEKLDKVKITTILPE
jgi:hypothetical protein